MAPILPTVSPAVRLKKRPPLGAVGRYPAALTRLVPGKGYLSAADSNPLVFSTFSARLRAI